MSSIKKMMDMTGRTAMITGATGKLGCVMSETLSELGANLILVDRPASDFHKLLKTLSMINEKNVICLECDLESQDGRDELIKTVKENTSEISVLVNNAAFVGTSDLGGWGVPFEEQTVDTWRRAIEVNLTAVFDLCQKLSPLMKNATGANIINISSIYGDCGPDWSLYEGTSMSNPAAYSASKGGLTQLTRWLSTVLAPYIRVNTISPGGIFRNQPTKFVERYCNKTPLARMASEDDFRGITAYLASDLSLYVTGQNIHIDGGWTVW